MDRFPELDTLPMNPGRRRMLDSMIEAGPIGVLMDGLEAAYYGKAQRPAQARASAATQLQRLRSQIAAVGFVVAFERAKTIAPGRFVLTRVVPAEPEPVTIALPTPAERLGIRAVTRMSGGMPVSVARFAWLEGAEQSGRDAR